VQECRNLLARRATAVEQKDAEMVTLKVARDEKLDRETRHKTSEECAERLRAAHAIGRKFDTMMDELAEYTAWAQPFVPEAGGLQGYCRASRQQIPETMELIGRLIATHAAAVLRGDAPATLRKPEIIVPPTIAPEAPTEHLFAMRPVRWKDAKGTTQVSQKFRDVYLTPAAAMRALATKACIQIGDPLRRQYHGTVGGSADPALAFDLDADPERNAEPILATVPPSPPDQQFKTSDYATRNPPHQLKIAGNK
jgi:hypothetical protein